MKRLTPRLLSVFLTIACVLGMIFVLYLQHVVHLEPCPLCIFQRLGLITLGVFSALFAIFNPTFKTRWFLWGGGLLGILWSVLIAVRHVWLTYLPADQVPSCGPGLNYWVDTLPLLQVLQEVLKGSGECAVIDWTWLGFSLPELSLAFFVILALLQGMMGYLLVKRR